MNLNPQFSKLADNCKGVNYIFIDPPWNYPLNKYNSEFWSFISFYEIFHTLTVPTLFIYVNLDKIPVMLSAFTESTYELKALIPYIRTAKNDSGITSDIHVFRNPIQYIAMFQLADAVPLPAFTKVGVIEPDNGFHKPVAWEDALFMQLLHENQVGLYILPDGTVADTDVSKVKGNTSMSKNELF